MSRDHKVPWRSEEQIEATANQVLKHVEGYTFNVMRLLRDTYMKGNSDGNILQLKIIPPAAKCKIPFVRFSPFELHATQRLVNAGDINLPAARHVLAHELGHIVMHRFYNSYFSTDGVKLNFLKNEESAEWQARCFAGYLLIPDSVLLEQKVNIQEVCKVPPELVLDRKAQFNGRLDRGYYTPRNCICGAFLARRHRLLLTCCGCGFQEQL